MIQINTYNFENLDDITRQFMLEEWKMDLYLKKYYLSPLLTSRGQNVFPDLVQNALMSGNENSLSLSLRNYMREYNDKGNKVPFNASEVLGCGIFNFYYCRGVATRAIKESKTLIIYRAKKTNNPRSDSQKLIGQRRNPQIVLDDLRMNDFINNQYRIPAPNSGLSYCLS